jgi:hypothetical protein
MDNKEYKIDKFLIAFLSIISLAVISNFIFLFIIFNKIEKQEDFFESDGSFKEAMTTFFWVGEPANDDNGFINNFGSIWDGEWQSSYGGFDDPDDRCGYKPCAFEPNENAFYFALPYNDLDEYGRQKDNAVRIPWFKPAKDGESILKNTWIEIVYNGRISFAQWEDVGPFETDDIDYVFGDSFEYKNKAGVGAGLDVSPAVRDYLAMETNDIAKWRFVEAKDVPDGPWKEKITVSEVNRVFESR